jgi:ureidoglycolate hydrolase
MTKKNELWFQIIYLENVYHGILFNIPQSSEFLVFKHNMNFRFYTCRDL